MKEQSLTQTALANQMQISQQSVSYWVKGKYEPSLAQLLQLCNILDTSPNELTGWDNNIDYR